MGAGLDWLSQPLTTLAFLWRLERADGIALGFTSHDRDLVREGFVYRAAPGTVPSAIEQSDGFDVGALDLAGALTSDALTEEDFRAGRWDGAALRVWATDWTNDDAAMVLLARGELGSVELRDGAFTVGVRGPVGVTDAPVVEETSPECRASLGDRRCRVDLAGRRTSSIVITVDGEHVTLAEPIAGADFVFGSLRWTQGDNAGLSTMIVQAEDAVLTLREAPAFVDAEPVVVELTQGCDRSFATCQSRFANALNFRGEPHLPGNDLLTRYGGA